MLHMPTVKISLISVHQWPKNKLNDKRLLFQVLPATFYPDFPNFSLCPVGRKNGGCGPIGE
jgi:hypothetical protein